VSASGGHQGRTTFVVSVGVVIVALLVIAIVLGLGKLLTGY
jgi:hypothetical protein